jgi:copper resistance protein D
LLISYFLSVFIHILSAVIWLGATVMVLLSVKKNHVISTMGFTNGQEVLPTLYVFRWIARICFFALFVTGLYNLFVRGYSWFDLADIVFWQGYFGETLMIKLLLFTAIVILSGFSDHAIGKLLYDNTKLEPAAARLLNSILTIAKINLLIGLLVLFCAIMLVRGRPW